MRWALEQLEAIVGPLEVASLYRSTPLVHGVLEPDDPEFLNTAVRGFIEPATDARRLLHRLKQLEHRAGRRATARDAPRPLDIDLLVGDRVLELPRLESDLTGDQKLWPGEIILPHPRLRQRRFVIEPLAELAPDLALPPDGRTPRQLLAALGEDQWVERVEWSPPISPKP